MNASQLHRWVLENIRPLGNDATMKVSELCGGEDTRDAFHVAAGRADGLHRAEDLLLDLIKTMQDQERADRLASSPDIGLCDQCGSEEGDRTNRPNLGWVCSACDAPPFEPMADWLEAHDPLTPDEIDRIDMDEARAAHYDYLRDLADEHHYR